jgi:CTP:molybdopterin cytidylyltransferase MocA
LGGERNKALLDVGGKPCVEYVLRAVERSAAFDSVVAVGSADLDSAIHAVNLTKPVERVDQDDTLAKNLRRAIEAASLEPGARMVMMTADIPLVTPTELDHFAALTEQSQSDAVVAFSQCDDWLSAHPQLAPRYRRSMILAQGGPYLMGNLFALNESVLEFAELIDLARSLRKQSRLSRIAKAFPQFAGIGIRSGSALRTYTRLVIARARWLSRRDHEWVPRIAPPVNAISRAVTKLVKGESSVDVVVLPAEGACFDLDTEEQLAAVRQIVE